MTNIEAIISEIRARLPLYLETVLGITAREGTHFKCPSIHHDDSHPSASFVPGSGGQVVKCFSCGRAMNIFQIATEHEGLPIVGREFITFTLARLANKLGVDYVAEEMSETDKKRLEKYRAHEDASEVLTSIYTVRTIDHPSLSRIAERGWVAPICQELGVGVIESFESYRSEMISKGWNEVDLESFGLLNRKIFSANAIIFSIKDRYGRVCGFSTRHYGKDNPKYVNSPNSDIYKKGEMLYLYNVARHYIKPTPLVMTEGYADAVTAHHHNMRNVVAVCGTTVTDDQIGILLSDEIRNILTCMDSDVAGLEATSKIIDKLSPYPSIHVKCCLLPTGESDGENDLDWYLQSGDIATLKHYSTFEWKIEICSKNTDVDNLLEQSIPTIVSENDKIRQYAMIRILSEHTSVPISIISDEVRRRGSEIASEKFEKMKSIRDSLVFDLGRSRKDIKSVLTDSLEQIHAIDRDYQRKENIEDEYLSDIQSIQESYMETKTACPGFTMPSFPRLQRWMNGFPKSGKLILIPGKPNAGKSSLLRNLAWDLINHNEDAFIIYMSIDDTRKDTITSIVSMLSGLPSTKLVSPRTWFTPKQLEGLDYAWRELANRSDRMIVVDTTTGNTLDAAERLVRYFQDKFVSKKIVLFIDAINNLSDYGTDELREQVEKKAQKIKNMCNRYDIPIVCSTELRKVSGRPKIDDIKETGKLAFLANFIMITHNELNDDQETNVKWDLEDVEEGTIPMPWLEIDVVKNKLSHYKGTLTFKLNAMCSQLEERPTYELPMKKQATSAASYRRAMETKFDII